MEETRQGEGKEPGVEAGCEHVRVYVRVKKHKRGVKAGCESMGVKDRVKERNRVRRQVANPWG